MRVLIVSDAWTPQVNGVVTSVQALIAELRGLGHQVKLLSPDNFRSIACPTYPEISLVWNLWQVGKAIRDFAPDMVHLATEGPLGWAARRWLQKRQLAFTTAIHTRFPEYLSARWPWLPLSWGYAWLRAFHRPSQAVLVSTERMRTEFASWGFINVQLWHKGVDTRLFYPCPQREAPAQPIFLYVGRLSAEKNIQAFLDLQLPGELRVVGDGPLRSTLQAAYPQASFLGYLHGQALAQAYRAASVLVFPSLTDTYGLVMLEALACGTPVAAFPVAGPLDVLQEGLTGVLATDLQRACLAALQLDRDDCAEQAKRQSWRASAQVFLAHQCLLDGQQCVLPEAAGTASAG
ncbi:MAG: glycosyltransferase family 1 protein [Pseudomonadaceae bacterium]|jgi:glycosyltransferase involved in cell wall biosynthesis|nr:glycosyltransferase family 1 protein [Pseudomonadaceae bacterium]